jgi:predicted nucleic acid-binding protein
VAYLFDTDAISEVVKKRPSSSYISWLTTIPRSEQFTSAVTIGELYKGAFRSPDCERHIENIERRVLPAVSVLPYDVAVARIYGEIEAVLYKKGQGLLDADLQIAATALYHGLTLVTANIRHFARIPDLCIHRALADGR